MPTPLVRLETEAGALYVRPSHVLVIAPGKDLMDDRGVRQRSLVQMALPDLLCAEHGRVQGWETLVWIVFGAPDEVARRLWPEGVAR